MLVIDDPQSWLDALPGPPDRKGRWCGEHLVPGDVMPDGSLFRSAGGTVTQLAGAVLVTVPQSRAAAYYGWVESGICIIRDGTVLTQIFRDNPCRRI